MKFKFLKACFLTLAVLAANLSFAQAVNNRGFVLKDEGVIVGFVRNLDIVSSMASCGIVNGDGVCTFTPPSTTLTAGSTVTSGFASPGLLGSSSNLLMAYTLSGTGTVIPTTASPTFTGTLTAATVTSSGGFYTYVGGSGVGFLGGASAFTPDNPRIQLFGSGLGGGMALHITGFDTAGNSYDYQNPCFAGLGTTACPDPTLSLHSIAASTTQAFSLGHNGTQGFLVANGGILARSLTYASGSDVALTLQGSLSGNIMNLKNSAGTTLSYFDSAGKFVAPDATGYQFASSVGGGYGINYRSASNQIEIIHGANAFFGVNTAVGTVVSTDGVSFSSSTVNAGSVDTKLQREAAATLQMGADVNGAAVNQTFKAHDGITGTDISGANLTIAAGRGTGAGSGGSLIFQTAPVLTTGTTAQTLVDRLTIAKDGAVAIGTTATTGTATTTIRPTISGSSTTSNFFNITGTLPASPSAVTYGVQHIISASASGQTIYGTGMTLTGSAALGNGNAALQVVNSTVNSTSGGDMFQPYPFAGGSSVVQAYSGGNDNANHAAFRGYSTNNGGTANHYGAVLMAAGVGGVNIGSAAQASTGATVNIGSAGWLGTAAPTLISSAGFFSNGSAALPIITGRDGNDTVFQVADGGATLVGGSGLGTSIVPLTVTPGTGSTANLLNLTNSAGTTLSFFDSTGRYNGPAGTSIATSAFKFNGYNTGFYLQGGGQGFHFYGNGNSIFQASSDTLELRSTGVFAWSSGPNPESGYDTLLKRGGVAATIQMGENVNGAAVNQTLKAHDGITGSNIAGASLTSATGRGTGNATPPDRAEQTAVPVASGTTAQTLGDRVRVIGKYTNLTEATATAFARVAVASSTVAGGDVVVTVEANDATDFQARTLTVPWSASNKAGTLTLGLGTPSEAIAASAGTLTCTLTFIDSGSGNADFKADCTSSLTQTVLRANAQVRKNFGTGAISAQ